MTDIPGAQDADLERAIDQAVMARFGGDQAGQTFADPKQVFCQNWSTVKQALEALKVIAPKYAWAIQVIITVGETAHGRICQG